MLQMNPTVFLLWTSLNGAKPQAVLGKIVLAPNFEQNSY